MKQCPGGAPGCEDGWEALVLPPSDDDVLCESDITGPADGGYTVVSLPAAVQRLKLSSSQAELAVAESLEGASGWYSSPPGDICATQTRAEPLGSASSEHCFHNMSDPREHAACSAALSASGAVYKRAGRIDDMEVDTFSCSSQADQGRMQQHDGISASQATARSEGLQAQAPCPAAAHHVALMARKQDVQQQLPQLQMPSAAAPPCTTNVAAGQGRQVILKGQRSKRRGALNWLLLLPAGVACMVAMARVLRSNASGGSRTALA